MWHQCTYSTNLNLSLMTFKSIHICNQSAGSYSTVAVVTRGLDEDKIPSECYWTMMLSYWLIKHCYMSCTLSKPWFRLVDQRRPINPWVWGRLSPKWLVYVEKAWRLWNVHNIMPVSSSVAISFSVSYNQAPFSSKFSLFSPSAAYHHAHSRSYLYYF